jgi:hypothetical protein
MISSSWTLLKEAVLSFMDDEALSRGAAIAFFAVTSLGPILLIVVAIAGLIFGHDTAREAITGQIHSLMGQQSAELLQEAMDRAGEQSSGVWGTVLGVGTLIVTASGVFGEMQSALNKIWRADPKGSTVSRLVRARRESRTGGDARLSADHFPRNQCGADLFWRLPEHRPSLWENDCRHVEHIDLLWTAGPSLRRHLQNTSR